MIPHHSSSNGDHVKDHLSASLSEAETHNSKSTSLLEQGESQDTELDLPLNMLILEDPEKLSEANELRWEATTRKKSLGDSLRFDELSVSSFFHDSFNSSTTTTFSASSTSFALDEDVPPRLPIRRTIAFADTVQVREFDVILGDDRLCKYPMTLSWKPSSEHSYNLHEREMERLLLVQEQKHYHEQQQQQQQQLLQTTSIDNDDETSPPESSNREDQEHHQDVLVCSTQPTKGGRKRRGGGINGARPLNARQRRLRLRSFGYSNNELLQSLRKRKIRLSLDYAYGHQPEDNLEAVRSFQDEHFRYIV